MFTKVPARISPFWAVVNYPARKYVSIPRNHRSLADTAPITPLQLKVSPTRHLRNRANLKRRAFFPNPENLL